MDGLPEFVCGLVHKDKGTHCGCKEYSNKNAMWVGCTKACAPDSAVCWGRDDYNVDTSTRFQIGSHKRVPWTPADVQFYSIHIGKTHVCGVVRKDHRQHCGCKEYKYKPTDGILYAPSGDSKEGIQVNVQKPDMSMCDWMWYLLA